MPLVEPVLVGSAAIFGSLLGSFLNVCVQRLPRGESVIRPRSRCPACGTPIAWRDNIPVVSWLALRGRCRSCRAGISARYPLVELAIALVWAGSVQWLGPTVQALGAGLFTTLMIGILLTDAQHMIIPDEFSLGGLGAGLALAAVALPEWRPLVGGALGALFGFGLFWAVGKAGTAFFKQEAMGRGDLKLMAMVGSFLGIRGVLATVLVGSVLGIALNARAAARAVPNLLLRIFAPSKVKDLGPLEEIPFGVPLAIAAVAVMLSGNRVLEWVGALLGP
ncbi:MAG: prepilin peptidase [Gemmatimonadetes bacterium]|nr:prepilin peptidase [Gemmatimonadota bacterium]